MTKQLFGSVLVASLVLLTGTAMAHAATVTFQQGVDAYSGSNSLRMRDNAINGKAGNDMYVGDAGNEADNRFLLRFDISSLAGQTVVGDGTLTLTIAQVDGSPNPGDFFDVYEVDDNNVGWSSSTSSWNRFNQDTSVLWKDSAGLDLPVATGNVGDPTLGGLGTPSQGYGATPIATINQASYAVNDTVDVTIPQAVLQDWVDGVNAGLLFRGRDQTNAGRVAFDKPTSGSVSERPLLTLDVVPSGTLPATIAVYDFNGPDGNFNTTAFDSRDTDPFTAASRLSQSGGLTGGGANAFIVTNAFFHPTDSGSPGLNVAGVNQGTPTEFFSFTTAPEPGTASVTYEDLSFFGNGYSASPKVSVGVVDGTGSEQTLAASISLPGNNAAAQLISVDLPDFTSANVVEWRFYPFGASASNHGIRFDDITLNGAVNPSAVIPEPLTMLAVGLSITGLGGYVRRRRRG